jgi:hypothetical protein
VHPGETGEDLQTGSIGAGFSAVDAVLATQSSS